MEKYFDQWIKGIIKVMVSSECLLEMMFPIYIDKTHSYLLLPILICKI